jgi:tRNA(Ile)-lysidine synthase
MSDESDRLVSDEVRRAALLADTPLLLAVSGGLDSMVLLRAMTRVARDRIAAVATFDHGTGPAARRAAAHVAREADRLGLRCVRGRIRADSTKRTGGLEAHWRQERMRFLRATAAEVGARIATAHTRDDQVETVLMRILRGSGARGLAALEAPGTIVRPLLRLGRSQLESYAASFEVTWVEDPSNADLTFLRNRVRRDLLPALRAVDPHIDRTLLGIGSSAARWRAEVQAFVAEHVVPRGTSDSVVVATSELAGYDRSSLCVVWGEIAGAAGLALDRRGTERCAAFTMKRPRGGRIPLAGGWSLEARAGELVLQRAARRTAAPAALPVEGALEWGAYRFSVTSTGPDDGRWRVSLPEGRSIQVRCWRPGDRLGAVHGGAARRVKRYLSDAGVHGSERDGWPVVTVEDEVVWIPGVRRSSAATVPSGGSARHYLCERTGS